VVDAKKDGVSSSFHFFDRPHRQMIEGLN